MTMPDPDSAPARERKCTNIAAYRFTWPGASESFICEHHADKLGDVARAMGLPLQVIPLTEHEEERPWCNQVVSR